MLKFIFAVILSFIIQNSCINSASKIKNDKKMEDVNVVKTSPNSTKEKDKVIKKKELAKRVSQLDEEVSKIIIEEDSEIQTVDTPFLKQGNIYKVVKFAPTHLIEIYIGVVGEDFTALIGDDEDKYFEFINKAETILQTDQIRISYLVSFLEVTKSQGERFQIINSVSDIKERPNLSEEQKQKFSEFQDKYKSVINLPKLVDFSNYKIFVIKGQNLAEYELTITENNLIKAKETILETDLLIPYAL